MHNNAPVAEAIREAYERYARYLNDGENTLTATDRQYLKGLEIDLPDDLDPVQQSGLHNVINDPSLRPQADDRKAAVINFILRAEEANLYCGQNICPPDSAVAHSEDSATGSDAQGRVSWQLSSRP